MLEHEEIIHVQNDREVRRYRPPHGDRLGSENGFRRQVPRKPRARCDGSPVQERTRRRRVHSRDAGSAALEAEAIISLVP